MVSRLAVGEVVGTASGRAATTDPAGGPWPLALSVAAATISYSTGPIHRECAVSQPEMQPEEAPRRRGVKGAEGIQGLGGPGGAEGPVGPAWPAGPRGGQDGSAKAKASAKAPSGVPGDLRASPFPQGDWGEPAQRLDELYHWAEARALQTVDWYLGDRTWKRRTARALRAVAVLSAAVGAVLLLLGLVEGLEGRRGAWGYVALLVAGVCVALDRFFGLTSGWMRDISTAQAVQRRLEAFQFEWASESVREVLGPTEGTASEAAERCLGVLRRFCEDLSELVRAETSGWILEFRSSLVPLHSQAPTPWDHRPDGGTAGNRVQSPPGSRASMPRQRPPEAR